jgi:hypothetical protein
MIHSSPISCDIPERELPLGTTAWGETFVRYQAKLSYHWSVLSYSMDFQGGLILVKENSEWKIRGNIMVMYF